jgi:hypothetical protein
MKPVLEKSQIIKVITGFTKKSIALIVTMVNNAIYIIMQMALCVKDTTWTTLIQARKINYCQKMFWTSPEILITE